MDDNDGEWDDGRWREEGGERMVDDGDGGSGDG
jgi:hypothetical protein